MLENQEELYRSVPKRIKLKREELGLTQTEMALKAGMKSARQFRRIEAGTSSITLEMIVKIADALNCSTDTLLIKTRNKLISAKANEIIDEFNLLSPEAQSFIYNQFRHSILALDDTRIHNNVTLKGP